MHSSQVLLTASDPPPFASKGKKFVGDRDDVLEWARTASLLINQLNFLMLYIAIVVTMRGELMISLNCVERICGFIDLPPEPTGAVAPGRLPGQAES